MRSLHKQRGFWNFVIPAVASLVGGALANESNEDNAQNTTRFNAAEAARTRDFNKAEAEIARTFSAQQADKQMGFQAEMSNTAYQRTIRDMQRAGLNPMLAYSQGGASTPSGAQGASAQANASAAQGVTAQNRDMIGPAVATALQFKQAEANIEQTQANTDLIRAQRDVTSQDVIGRVTQQENTRAQTEQIKEGTKQIAAQTNLTEKQAEKVIQDVKESYSREDLNKVEHTLKQLSIAEAKAFEKYYEGIGKWSPEVRLVLEVLRSIISIRR